MNNDWLMGRLSYSDILQASGDDLRGAWRLEHEVPPIPAIRILHRHNWIRGIRTLKIKMQMATEIVVWHPTELFSKKKDVGGVFEFEHPRIEDAWIVA